MTERRRPDPGRELAGVFVPITTPFRAGAEEVDLPTFRAQVERLGRSPIRGLVVAGTTGEGPFLQHEEKLALFEAAREALPPDRLVIAGAGAETTREAISLCKEAAAAGADFVLVKPPSFYRRAMTPAILAAHYRDVADGSPAPVIFYIVPPSCASVDVPDGLLGELSVHPNIAGLKDSRGDLAAFGAALECVRDGFRVFIGNGAKLYAALEIGAAGGVLGVANLVPWEAAGIFESFVAGRLEDAGRLQERIAPLHQEIVAAHGAAGVKAALDVLGFGGGPPRRPLRPLDPKTRERIRSVLGAAGLRGAGAELLDTPGGAA